MGLPAEAVVVAILTRAPSAGGKRRLFDALGMAPDPDLLRALLLDTLDAADSPGSRRAVYVTPSTGVDEVRALVSPEVAVRAQRDGDLGARMAGVFDDLFEQGATAVVLMGSDLPRLPPTAIPFARETLAARPDAVAIGPASDGGYYLIAARRTPGALFEDVPWGSAAVLRVTLARAEAAGLAVALGPDGSDVDRPGDLRALAEVPDGATRTRQWLAAHRARIFGIKE